MTTSIGATGARRRLQALAVMGHPLPTIATHARLSYGLLARIRNNTDRTIHPDTAARIARAYRQLIGIPGTDQTTRELAIASGWPGPMAWDEDTIDNPVALPEGDTEPRRLGVIERGLVAAEEVRHLAAFGTSTHEIARRVGRSPSYVRSILTGTRAPGWRDRLDTAA